MTITSHLRRPSIKPSRRRETEFGISFIHGLGEWNGKTISLHVGASLLAIL